MFRKVRLVIPKCIIDKSKDVIKDRRLIAYVSDMDYFQRVYQRDTRSRTVSTLDVTVFEEKEGIPSQRKLKAHQLTLPSSPSTSTSTKLALVGLTGNCFYVAETLPKWEPLLKRLIQETQKTDANVTMSLFCQDYRGRGFNKQFTEENFNDYPTLQDAIDQAALIKKLVEQEGYSPENILLLSHSYGSAVGLWALYLLVKEDIKYARIKMYSDRGYGNLLDYPFVNFFLSDQKEAHQLLHALQMMPDMFLHEIANQLPETFVTNTKNEEMVAMNIGLIQRLKVEEMPGRVWLMDASNPYNINPHLAEHSHIKPENMKEVITPYFMLAMLLEKPIRPFFPCPTLQDENGKSIEGYALKEGATPGQKEHITLPLFSLKKEEKVSGGLSVKVESVSRLIAKLHAYCLERAKEARDSGYGEEHKRAWVGKTSLFGWTAKEQIETAIYIMECLAKEEGPDIEALQVLQLKVGAYETGRLHEIFTEVMKFIADYQQLLYFNQWVMAMPQRREEREDLAAKTTVSLEDIFAPNPGIGRWDFLESHPEEEQQEENWQFVRLRGS